MAIFGNETSPHNVRARVGVKRPEELGLGTGVQIITNTSRLFAAKVTLYCHNETLTEVGVGPTVFRIVETIVFFKNTKKIVQFWSIEYLRTEAPAVDVVFRRLTDFDIDQKYQDFEDEGFTVFFPTGTNETSGVGSDKHAFWTGCDYWPQNYSLAVTWTNETIEHWTEPDASHHVGFIAYFPNCSNWNTDDWNYYLYNLHVQWEDPVARRAWQNLNPPGPGTGPLSVRFGGQPTTREYRAIDASHYVGANLLMGQWNFTLTSATTRRKAMFVNVLGITNCSNWFGYVEEPFRGDWDSWSHYCGGRTISEIKYLLSEVFNATYKLSSEWLDVNGVELSLDSWYPFSGVHSEGLEYVWNNTWIKRSIGEWEEVFFYGDPRNTTFIYGESVAHNGMVFTSQAASVVDVVGGTEVGEDFGGLVGWTDGDPWWEAMWDTKGFMGEAFGPFYGVSPNFFMTVAGKDFIDGPPTPVTLSYKFSGWRRPQNRTNGESGVDWDLFTTPTGAPWDINHTVVLGGPKVNLAAEYFNDHTWAVWTSSASGCEIPELANGGIYVFPSGNIYTSGFSVITICDDLNLTSMTAIYDEEVDRIIPGPFSTDLNPWNNQLDGPTLVDPYAGLLIWGISGWDTRAAANWLAQYRWDFDDLCTNATYPKYGATTIILHTPHVAEVFDNPAIGPNQCLGEYGIKEILGPVAGRWRHSVTAWGVWITVPCSIDWTP